MALQITLTRPDDFHLHLRDGDALATTVPATANTFARAIIMPNLKPPVTTAAQAAEYKQRILAHIPQGSSFDPMMTLYLTDQTTPEMIRDAKAGGDVRALKLYPAGATTNSDSGVTALENIYPALEAMIDAGLPLLVHGEVTDTDIDIYDREKVFIDRYLIDLVSRYPELKLVLEHITTNDAVAFVSETGANVGATITPQHLLYNRNHMLVGGIRPHFYCLPVLKRNVHQLALIQAATSGNAKFFLGTDSAPHVQGMKETSCGCAGCYSAFGAIELYAEVFEKEDALNKLEGFASHFGADFYDIPRNTDTITLVKKEQPVPESIPFTGSQVVPLKAGEHLLWSRSV
ncbi:dihydroorotase [Sansalvadorimonas verongulae]|uniref:dihydroorotase n=1 Tax=Sansalvadorimonas verongulae TaxID=2172824 RepID=UPI002E346F44|nr:dihydroorotase [Sansalvadorimonas verongulae]MTI12735.1 dihydroorotase [Sansalvadorimonas verongulae]